MDSDEVAFIKGVLFGGFLGVMGALSVFIFFKMHSLGWI
jgi:hypothetical protein